MCPQLISSYRRVPTPPILSDTIPLALDPLARRPGSRILFDMDTLGNMPPVGVGTNDSPDTDHAGDDDSLTSILFDESAFSDDEDAPPSTQPRPADWRVLPFLGRTSPSDPGDFAMEQYMCFVYRGEAVSIARISTNCC